MPTYEFVCPNGHQFDKFYRKMSDSVSELPCSVCGEVATRKISGGAGLVFKGSGFYITDYGKDGKKGMTQPSASPAGDGGGRNGAGTTGGKGDGASSSDTSKGSEKPAPAAKSTDGE